MSKQLKQYEDLAKKGSRKQPRCPHPGCPSNQEPYTDPWDGRECTLYKPLWMVIPPEGVHISCPVHPEGHHIYGSGITWDPMWRENNLPDRRNEPRGSYDPRRWEDSCTGTGFTGKDTFKFSM
jgi:hypothetical protein